MKFHIPKELWDGPKKVLSDWPGCDRWVEKNGEVCGLIGGDGDGELKGAELLKDPGILTGAELWNWLPPIKGRQIIRSYAHVQMHIAKCRVHIEIVVRSMCLFLCLWNTQHNSHIGQSWAALQAPLQRRHTKIIQVEIIQGWLCKTYRTTPSSALQSF